MNVSRPPQPGTVTLDRPDPPILPPFPGVVSKDEPGPSEQWWRKRYPGQHAVPYELLTVRKSLALYDAMLLDESVAYAHKLKITSRLSSGWSLSPPLDKEGDPLPGTEEPLDLISEVLEKWDRFDEFLEQMLDGTRQGFKLGEIVTAERKIGGKARWAIDDVLVRNSRFFAFDTGPSGRILDDGILEFIDQNPDGSGIQTYWSPEAVARHSPEKFVRWTYSPKDSNAYSLYGTSDFHACYRTYFMGDNELKALGETIDTYKHPIAVGIARPGLTDVQRSDFLSALEKAITRKALVIPGEYLPDGLDPQKAVWLHEVTGKADQIVQALGYLDTAKMRALLVGQLVAETGGDGKGSYALGKQHVSIFLRIMQWVGKSLGTAIGRHLFRRIVAWNLGEEAAEMTPSLMWHAAGDAETLERAQIIGELLDKGAIDPREKWIRDYVGQFPKMDEELAATKEAEDAKRLDAETQLKPDPAGGPPKGKAGTLAADDPQRADADADRPAEIEERHLDDTEAAAYVERYVERASEALRRAWISIFNGPGGIEAWARVALASDRAVPLRIDSRPLESVVERMVAEGIALGAIDAFEDVALRLADNGETLSAVEQAEDESDEVVETLGRKPASKPKTVFTFDLDEFARARGVDLPAKLRTIAKRARLSKRDLDAYAAKRIADAVAEIRAQRDRLIDEAKAAVARARSAKGKADRRKELRALKAKWAGIEGDISNEQSALSDALTNAAYNEGRVALYLAMPEEVLIGFMYSAIRDGRTTQFCLAWDRYRAPRNSPVWRRIIPPNHWHCRSKIVGILRGEIDASGLATAAMMMPSERPAKGFRRSKFKPSL